jgi:hypothetical protein
MAKSSAVSHFVAVSDLSKPVAEQEGILVEVKGTTGDTPRNREKALEIVREMWEKEEIDLDLFPDGITQENIHYVPPNTNNTKKSEPSTAVSEVDKSPESSVEDTELLPIVEGAREIIQLTKLQIEVQEASEQAAQYIPIIQTILKRSRPLTPEEIELAKDKKYGKTIERLGSLVAEQEEYQEKCSGNGNLILNAIAWQLNRQQDETKN